jgi:indole-3-glycerol phosphate synthase
VHRKRRRRANADPVARGRAMNVLERILEQKKIEIDALADEPAATVFGRKSHDVVSALARREGPLRLIAEIKFKSPSAGTLSAHLTVKDRALAYARAGASMVSVLCDGSFFGGSWEDVARARSALDAARRAIPVLAKEFILDPVQLAVAQAKGADAVLLIARIVSAVRLGELADAALDRDLEPIVEVTSLEELASALSTRARVIAVNARDLETLTIDPARAASILERIPADRIALHFSGVKSVEDVRAIAARRADGALVGEALMREDEPSTLLTKFVAAAASR